MNNDIITIKSTEYKNWLKDLKQKVRQTQIKASVQVNTTMLKFYWNLAADIVEKQKDSIWGSGFLKQLSKDLMSEFPDIKGFSYVNLNFVRRWFLFYNEELNKSVTACYTFENGKEIEKGQQALPQIENKITQIPWGHNIQIISKCKSIEQALFYVNKTIKYGWSRAVLIHQIEGGLFEREGRAITNFTETMPKAQSDLANEMLKDPYKFDFLNLGKEYNERNLENALLDHITKFLLELGAGFAFIGRQKALKVGEREFIIDLLFYHTQMHCYVVVELKVVDFEPEFAGKLNFYLKAVDEQIKTERDEATIGILICKNKDKTVVEYALSDIHKPMGVSEYQLTQSLLENLKLSLPTLEEIEVELNKDRK